MVSGKSLILRRRRSEEREKGQRRRPRGFFIRHFPYFTAAGLPFSSHHTPKSLSCISLFTSPTLHSHHFFSHLMMSSSINCAFHFYFLSPPKSYPTTSFPCILVISCSTNQCPPISFPHNFQSPHFLSHIWFDLNILRKWRWLLKLHRWGGHRGCVGEMLRIRRGVSEKYLSHPSFPRPHHPKPFEAIARVCCAPICLEACVGQAQPGFEPVFKAFQSAIFTTGGVGTNALSHGRGGHSSVMSCIHSTSLIRALLHPACLDLPINHEPPPRCATVALLGHRL